MRIIIRCAGGETRWGNFGGSPKHLVKLAGERLLDRTVRITREVAPDADIRIVVKGRDHRYMVDGARRWLNRANPENGDVDKILSAIPIFSRSDRTVVLFGDVWWAEEDLESILTDPVHQWGAWLRVHGDGGEIFGFAFEPEAVDTVEYACQLVADAHRSGFMPGIPGGWALYRTLCGQPIDKHGDHGHSHPVSDWTDDMDTPEDWHGWCYRYACVLPLQRPA